MMFYEIACILRRFSLGQRVSEQGGSNGVPALMMGVESLFFSADVHEAGVLGARKYGRGHACCGSVPAGMDLLLPFTKVARPRVPMCTFYDGYRKRQVARPSIESPG